MTRLTFGVSASPFAANTAVKENAIDFGKQYPQAAQVVHESFYIEDELTGGDTCTQGGFVLRKLKTSVLATLKHVSPRLLDEQSTHEIVDTNDCWMNNQHMKL